MSGGGALTIWASNPNPRPKPNPIPNPNPNLNPNPNQVPRRCGHACLRAAPDGCAGKEAASRQLTTEAASRQRDVARDTFQQPQPQPQQLRSRSRSRSSSSSYYLLTYCLQGIEAAFCSEEDKAALRLRFASFYAE